MQDEITLHYGDPDEVMFEINGTTVIVRSCEFGIEKIVTDDGEVIYPEQKEEYEI